VTPPPAAAQRAASVRATRAPSPRVPAKRPSLRILEPRPGGRGRLLRLFSAAMVVGSLLTVVVGHSILAQGQVRLTAAQTQMAAEEAIHRQLLAAVAEAENPARIIAEAKKLNLVPPSSVTQLPAVPLTTPIGQAATTPSAAAPSGSTSTAAAGQSAAAGR
jgi:hypothetical protein